MRALSIHSLLDLIKLFEQSVQRVVCDDGQILTGIPGWKLHQYEALDSERISEWCDCIGYAGYYPASYGNDHSDVDVFPDDESDRYLYRCPESFEFRSIEAAEIAIYHPREEQFLNAMADLLDIPLALRSGISQADIQGTLWRIGKVRLGHTLTDVWVARGLALSVDAVFHRLQQTDLSDLGIILTTGNSLPAIITVPRHYRVIPIKEVIDSTQNVARIDMERLRLLMTGANFTDESSMSPVHFDEYTNTLTISTNPTPWMIRGPKQAAAIKYMAEQAYKGRWELSAAEILKAVNGNKTHGICRRIPSLFNGNDDWHGYIMNIRRGVWGFIT
ncbi:hypothetical protein GH975_08415 [Litorivicinus lipolyticus]|uniref:Uncharacterized protein n=1 Tax=Litorivicinus lipolyticus TaxID=418701 RepID=A0A5Q2QE38_9GAMM|nr:hypothetical protein [Litorivicinus lipolyticus]QGG80592.1 hypothetical protein GH975_08415 [Litorivicinus lipolyticus]